MKQQSSDQCVALTLCARTNLLFIIVIMSVIIVEEFWIPEVSILLYKIFKIH